MDGRGGCCIARYVPGATHVSTVDKIMLRFRPIAPKPIAGTTVSSDGSSSESNDAAFLRTGKRKYVKNNNNTKRRTRRKKNTSPPEQKQTTPAVTLPLLPNSPAKDLPKPAPSNNNKKLNKNEAVWLNFEKQSMTKGFVEPYGAVMGGWCSCVTVECVTDTWVDSEWLGSTDEERRVKLSRDTCPGFISDGYGRVTWTNEAYGEMMMGEGKGAVLLVMKVGAVVPYTSFTCRVRVVQYACGRERSTLTVPCDVWRMDSGGFAWRLDVKAALSLRFGY